MQGIEVFDDTSLMLSKMMEVTHEHHRVISNNLANVNTPGYKRQVLDFATEFEKLLKGDRTAMEHWKPTISTDEASPARKDGNNVNLAKETNYMMQNGIYNQLLARALKAKVNIMRTAMSGGGR